MCTHCRIDKRLRVDVGYRLAKPALSLARKPALLANQPSCLPLLHLHDATDLPLTCSASAAQSR